MNELSRKYLYCGFFALLCTTNNFVASESSPQTKCQMKELFMRKLGIFTPQCDENGDYLPVQCSDTNGYCWCVDENGAEIPGTKKQGQVNCTPINHQTKCQKEASSVIPMPGTFIPRCDENGDYRPKQCYGSIGVCWCVYKNGTKVSGTDHRVSQNLNCDE